MRVKTMSFDEFFNKTDIKTLDKMIGHIRRHKRIYKQLVALVAIFMMSTSLAHASGLNTKAIDNLGWKILHIVRSVAYWVVIIKGSSEVIGQAVRGDTRGAFKTLMVYVGIFAIFYLFPMALDLVKEAFSG